VFSPNGSPAKDGEVVEIDLRERAKFLNKALAAHLPEAALEKASELGDDHPETAYWIEKAAEQGHPEAKGILRSLDGTGCRLFHYYKVGDSLYKMKHHLV